MHRSNPGQRNTRVTIGQLNHHKLFNHRFRISTCALSMKSIRFVICLKYLCLIMSIIITIRLRYLQKIVPRYAHMRSRYHENSFLCVPLWFIDS